MQKYWDKPKCSFVTVGKISKPETKLNQCSSVLESCPYMQGLDPGLLHVCSRHGMSQGRVVPKRGYPTPSLRRGRDNGGGFCENWEERREWGYDI